MGIKKMALVAALGLSMASAPVIAQTRAPTVAERAGASMDEANGQDVEMSTTTYIIAFFVIIAIGLGIYVAVNNEEQGRTSP